MMCLTSTLTSNYYLLFNRRSIRINNFDSIGEPFIPVLYLGSQKANMHLKNIYNHKLIRLRL